ncbi:MAG TPA: sulfotransferase [Chloroflexota bacterium]|nr:sulfotransferase [Chloroflexota bacterium]
MESPIIIVAGMPRSGTSLMMQMLAAGGVPALTDHLREADEDNPRGYFEFEAVKQVGRNAGWLDQAPGKAVKMVYLLLYDLPMDRRYRVIFMKRDLSEVVASQDEMLRRHGEDTGGAGEAELVEIYRRQLARVEGWLAEQPNVDVLYVDHHEVLARPELVVARIGDFLGQQLDTDAMLRVPDRSLYRQRR